MNTFTWLLKREYWENRGGFLWAPVWASGIILAMSVFGVIMGELGAHRANITIGVNIGDLIRNMTPGQMQQLGAGLDIGLYWLSAIVAVVLFFVLFFYLIGALYNDRRDHSVLFWKSLPITDTQTVLSKVVSATLLAPVLAVGVSLVLMFAFLLLMSVVAAFHGVNPITMIWMNASPLTVAGKLILLIPINALWALPCIGWLLLISAFAKRAPFLFAVLVPVFAGILITSFDLMNNLHIPDFSFWRNVVGRILFSVLPGSWIDLSQFRAMEHSDGPLALLNALSMPAIGEVLTRPGMWIGAVAGAGMIAASVWVRRWRDDS
jgi:ABC-2 type transport system permease protein